MHLTGAVPRIAVTSGTSGQALCEVYGKAWQFTELFVTELFITELFVTELFVTELLEYAF